MTMTVEKAFRRCVPVECTECHRALPLQRLGNTFVIPGKHQPYTVVGTISVVCRVCGHQNLFGLD